MPPSLSELLRNSDPRRMALVLGAGAAHSSGAPLAIDLCRHLESELAGGKSISDDLAELSSILEQKLGRKSVIECIAKRLAMMEPDGALLALASYPWLAIYSTNYDRLVERAYQIRDVPLGVVRSNYDWEAIHTPGRTSLFKIHGCISQDRSLGHQASMILSSDDYLSFEAYRSLLFKRLATDMAGTSCWIIGHSLQDPHIKELLVATLREQRESGAPGRIHLLVYAYDGDRAQLWLSRGVQSVVQGDINAFVDALANAPQVAPLHPQTAADRLVLPVELAAATIDVSSTTQPSNPRRLFYGGAATYSDIRAGLTFQRDQETTVDPARGLGVVITGVAGTGKTTLARRILLEVLDTRHWMAFEHRGELPLQPDRWLRFERTLRESQRNAVLLIDNCPTFQRQLNILARGLPEDSALRLIVTAETSAWRPRQKDPRLFSHTQAITLSRLSLAEIQRLRSLVLAAPSLNPLVDSSFKSLSRHSQEDLLKQRCSADMFVCLKVLFTAASLDDIILKEYSNIEASSQEIYRLTAALEAAGALPHRQMVLRLSGMTSTMISGALDVLEGLVHEQDIEGTKGIFLWRTRHEVIARIISEYKYSDSSELLALLQQAIDTANPSYFEEMRSLREMCNAERGIRALPEAADRIDLYRRIVRLLPSDRVARHRLVRELIEAERFGDAEAELRSAIKDVRLDPPLQRYKIKMLLLRSRGVGLMEEDRRAILRTAQNEAEWGLQRFPDNKYMYFIAGDVAEEWFELTGERGLLEWAKHQLAEGHKSLLDPDLQDRLSQLGGL
jgi:hypothetical protein